MRAFSVALAIALALATLPAFAHGPQIQTTRDTTGKIITRKIVDDTNYHTELTNPTSLYVMPLSQYLGVWRAQPDNSRLSNGDPAYVGWPGFAYGYGYDAISNPQPFPVGSKFILGFTQGLQAWDGTIFDDAGPSELEAYRGPSNAPTALAKTSDSGPFQSLMFPGGAGISFTAEGNETHNTANYRMLGDGSSLTSALDDGIYVVGMQLSSTASASVTPSDPFYFVLHQKADPAALSSAVASLGFAADAVQVIPEPGSSILALAGITGLGGGMRIRRQQKRR
jgi:hypothetical protein